MPVINHHTLLSCQGQDDIHWEQCVRMLLVNPISHLLTLQSYINKIVENILMHPSEEKYLKLKTTNAVLQKNIFSVNGGLELLLSIGFQFELDPITAEKYLVFPLLPMASLQKNTNYKRLDNSTEGEFTSEYIERLQSCRPWLENTIKVCLEFQQNKVISNPSSRPNEFNEIPADSIAQLQLPTGKVAIGGFMKGDCIGDIWKFACSFYTVDRHSLVKLRLPHEPVHISSHDFGITIENAGYFPRIKFIVNALDESQTENLKIMKAHTTVLENAAIDRKKIYDEKKKKKEEQLARENERKKTLQAFKDDRLEKKMYIATEPPTDLNSSLSPRESSP